MSRRMRGLTRRDTVFGVGAVFVAGAGFTSLTPRPVRAAASIDAFDVTGTSVESDDGTLTSLIVTADVVAEYDGLDTDAADAEVSLFAATGAGETTDSSNRIASAAFTVAMSPSLNTRAGTVSHTFSAVDVLGAADVEAGDFTSVVDGESAATELEFRLAFVVRDGSGGMMDPGATLLSAARTTTSTVTVTNQAKTGVIGGSGETNGSGPDQTP